MKKHFLSIAMAFFCLAVAGCGDSGTTAESYVNSVENNTSVSDNTEPEDKGEQEVLPESETEPEVPEEIAPEVTHVGDFEISGDRLFAKGGRYEQDGNLENGPEQIEWIVLSDNGDSLLLLSKSVLECIPFGYDYSETDWNSSFARNCLNDAFYNQAFNDAEKAIISDYATTQANDELMIEAVYDKVFLLSLDEVNTYLSDTEDGTNENRMAQVTEFARANGVWYISEENFKLLGFKDKGVSEAMIGAGNWWLRDNGAKMTQAMDVGASGVIRTTGHDVGSKLDGIRPAILIRVSE